MRVCVWFTLCILCEYRRSACVCPLSYGLESGGGGLLGRGAGSFVAVVLPLQVDSLRLCHGTAATCVSVVRGEESGGKRGGAGEEGRKLRRREREDRAERGEE